MPIPSQNEFLLPFLTILSDGQSYTRSQILFNLAKHFDISEDEAQAMSGQQNTLVSRVAWCDVHFVKAGFVTKTQHRRTAFRMNFAYLQGFYLGKVHRGAGSDDATSDAELTLYAAFDKLPDPFTVLHSVKWFARDYGTVGEVDFLIALCHGSFLFPR